MIMRVIGVTGNFGAGKSYVASIFGSLGAGVLDADKIAHGVIKKGSPAYKKTIRIFGTGILDNRRNIDRRKLAGIVFSDRDSLRKLNAIVHPEVINSIKKRLGRAGAAGVMVIDAPLLVEANLTGLVDKLVVVRAPRKIQVERCAGKFRMKKEEVMKRLDSQMPTSKKIKFADFVVDNGGTRSKTRKQILKIWRRIGDGNSRSKR